MSLNLNRAIISGRVCKDPELKMTNSGTPVCNVLVAVDRPKPKDKTETITDFLDCTAFSNTAQFISNYFKKGQSICIEGSIQMRQYEKDNQKRVAWSILVAQAHFVESKGNTAPNENNAPVANSAVPTLPQFAELPDDSDLPF